MNYSVVKNPVPLVWLDSNMIIALGKARTGKTTTENIVKMYEILRNKTLENKLIIVEHEQSDELGTNRAARDTITTLSLGVETDHYTVQERQDISGVKAFLSGYNHRAFNVNDFFDEDPNRQSAESRRQALLIRATMPRTDVYKKKDKESRQDMGFLLNKTRDSNLLLKYLNKQAVYERHVENERHALRKALTNSFTYLTATKLGYIQPNPDTYQENYNITNAFCLLWEHGGGEPSDIDKMLDFFDSPFYWNLPFHDIWIDLYSRRLTGIHGGGEFKQSDIKDIRNISSMLPICQVITLDRAMADLVEKSGLAAKYSTRIFSNRNVDKLLEYLESL